jgi:hypothetical protein
MNLFHFAPLALDAGSVIQPGNWGRLLKRYGVPEGTAPWGNPWLLARELIFETVREKAAPALPSRMGACFALPDMPAADAYRAENDPGFKQVLHQVELLDPTAPTHSGALALLRLHVGSPFLDTTRSSAIQYWRGEGDGFREIVTASALRVVACLR